MPNNYPFIDATGSVVSAHSSIVGGSHFPIIKVDNFPADQTITGSVVAVASGNQSVSGTIHVDNFSSVVSYQLAGSILAVNTATTANQSVSGTVGASIVGTVPVTQVTNPWTVRSSIAGGIFPVSGSVAAVVTNTVVVAPNNSSMFSLQLAGSVLATSATAAANQSVSGTVHVDNFSSVVSYQLAGSVLATSATAAANQSVSGTVHIDNFSSVVSYQLAGSVLATSATAAANQSVSGTVVVNQGTGFGSVAAHIKSGSVIAVLGGNTSVISIPATRTSIQGTVVLTSTSVTTMVAAGGAGVSNHITDIMIANTGASNTLVTFTSNGGASILGYTIAPTLGGSNINGLVIPISTPANTTFNIQAATATSTLYATVKGYRA